MLSPLAEWKGKIEDLLTGVQDEFEKAVSFTRDLSWRHFGKRIYFYAPSFIHYKSTHFCSSPMMFPSISVTGSFCALNCKHCGGAVLKNMLPAVTPQQLVQVCSDIKQKGGIGCLISGGCLPDGSVPIDKFVDAIAEIKRKLGLTIMVHTGIIDFDMARRLKEAGVDAALIDIIGSDQTINEICRLNVHVSDYDKSLLALHKAGISLVPHVLVGLHYGKLMGEFKALQIIAKYSPSAVIIIALMPVKGTVIQDVAPPTPEDIAKVLVIARLMLPETPQVLGCMRPKGKHRAKTDKFAVKTGVNAIAFPDEQAIQLAESMEIVTMFSSFCCSQIFEDIRHKV